MIPIVSLIGGLVLLLAGGHYLVAGGVSLARHFNISTLVVGITVIAFGTSAPELIVSLNANFQGHPDITLGNVIGSNIANIGLVLGLSAIVLPIVIREGSLHRDWFTMLASYILLAIFFIDGEMVRWEGLIFVALLCAFIYSSVSRSRKEAIDSEKLPAPIQLWASIGMVACAVAALSIGADLLVSGASSIARLMGISERIISVSLIAFGTSVPELATSIIAAFKKEADISVGNIVGSNIFNILGVIGLSTSAFPIAITGFWDSYSIDFAVMFGFSVLLFLATVPLKRGIIDRWKGCLFVASYIGYIFLLF